MSVIPTPSKSGSKSRWKIITIYSNADHYDAAFHQELCKYNIDENSIRSIQRLCSPDNLKHVPLILLVNYIK